MMKRFSVKLQRGLFNSLIPDLTAVWCASIRGFVFSEIVLRTENPIKFMGHVCLWGTSAVE